MTMYRIYQYATSPTALSGIGVVLGIIGVSKIAGHIQAGQSFIGSICGEGGTVSGFSAMAADVTHCWGCPVSALGIAFLAMATMAARGTSPLGPALQTVR